MSTEESRSELVRFKEFLNNHPPLVREIRKNGRSWQELYEQWVLLGEEDEHWNKYKEEQGSENMKKEKDVKEGEEQKSSKMEFNKDMMKQILKYTESMDMEKLQHQVHQLSGTISAIQEVVKQFQGSNSGSRPDNPFQWFRD